MLDVAAVRTLFPVTREAVILDNASDAPCPLPVVEHIAAYLDRCARVPRQERSAPLSEWARGRMARLLGALKAGGTYVPFEPRYPVDRIEFILEDSRVPIVLAEGRLASAVPACGARVIRLDSDWPITDHEPIGAECGASADRLAYVIYTSGTTGRPKA